MQRPPRRSPRLGAPVAEPAVEGRRFRGAEQEGVTRRGVRERQLREESSTDFETPAKIAAQPPDLTGAPKMVIQAPGLARTARKGLATAPPRSAS